MAGGREGGGLWAEGSALDRADKALSKPVFELQLPAPAEVALLVPGAWMGLPFAFLGPTPLLIAWLSGKGGPWAGAAAGISWAAGLGAFFGGMVGWWGSSKALKASLVTTPALTALLLQMVEPAGRALALASISCSTLAGLATLPPKMILRRKRPVVSLAEKITQCRSPVTHKYLESMLSENQRLESHPSGDTAVMAANAVLLLTSQSVSMPVAVAAVLTTGVGRMYFWAHHFLDVAAGGGIGLVTALACVHRGFGSTWRSCGVCYVIFVVSAALYLKSMRVK